MKATVKPMQKHKINFTEELIRRKRMTPEELTKERDQYFLKDHEKLISNVRKELHELFNTLPEAILNHESSQIVGYFQSMLEHGGFCSWGEHARKGNRGFLPIRRVRKKDLQSLLSNLKKVDESMRRVLDDPGMGTTLQQILWDYVDAESAKNTRKDLFLFQIFSAQEILIETVTKMIKEDALFRRDEYALKKARCMIIYRLAFLFEFSKNPAGTPNTLFVLNHFLKTMTKAADWGDGRKSNPGNKFICVVQRVLKALDCENESQVVSISGTTIRQDIQAVIKELGRKPSNIQP